jgi:uncharacterized protein YuzB (UPF0349 family)
MLAAASSSQESFHDTKNGKDRNIRGYSPVRYCSNPDADLFAIKEANIVPNPIILQFHLAVEGLGTYGR